LPEDIFGLDLWLESVTNFTNIIQNKFAWHRYSEVEDESGDYVSQGINPVEKSGMG
jgi:hypothetical protein